VAFLAVVAILIVPAAEPAGAAATTSWRQFGGNPAHTGVTRGPTVFTSDTIDDLTLAWTRDPGYGEVSPAYARGRVFVAVTRLQRTALLVLDAHTGRTRWRGVGLPSGTPGQPVIAGGYVYVTEVDRTGTDDAHLAVYPTRGCGDVRCKPIWTASWYQGSEEGGEFVVGDGQPTVARRRVYVNSIRRLLVFDAAGCGAATCEPLWTAPHDFAYGVATVAGDRVYAHDASQNMAAYPADGCGEPTCPPLWSGRIGYANPIVTLGNVFIQSSQSLAVYPEAGCSSSPCEPSWTVPTGVNGIGGMAVDARQVYIANHRLIVAAADGCGASVCPVSWTGEGDGSATGVSVTNDVALVSSSESMAAFDTAGCGAAVCEPIMTWPFGGAHVFYARVIQPVVGEDIVLLGGTRLSALQLRSP
jgi:outer membrane protein assembly factor BamB